MNQKSGSDTVGCHRRRQIPLKEDPHTLLCDTEVTTPVTPQTVTEHKVGNFVFGLYHHRCRPRRVTPHRCPPRRVTPRSLHLYVPDNQGTRPTSESLGPKSNPVERHGQISSPRHILGRTRGRDLDTEVHQRSCKTINTTNVLRSQKEPILLS